MDVIKLVFDKELGPQLAVALRMSLAVMEAMITHKIPRVVDYIGYTVGRKNKPRRSLL